MLGLLLALAVIAAFVNGLKAPFLLDDQENIVANESLRDLGHPTAVLWPRADVFTAGRPLLNLSLALNHAAGQLSPVGYRATNILIHAAAALVLFGLVRRTLLLPGLAPRLAPQAAPLAALAALLWAVHPLQTESVTYVSQRAESLMGLWYLLTLYAFLRATGLPGWRWRFAAVAACAAGMMTKEVMVTAPVLVLLFDRACLAGSFAEAWRRRRGLHLALASTWLILAVLMLTTRMGARGVGYGISLNWHEYLRIEAGAVLHYLRLAMFPSGLVFDYGEEVPVPAALTTLIEAATLAVIAALALSLWRRRPPLGWLVAAVFLVLAPTSSFVPVTGQPIAENRLYLPLAALAVLATLGLAAGLGRRAPPVLLAVAAALAWGTARRNHDYRSELAIWADTVAKQPGSGRAHAHYAKAVLDAGQPDLARAHWQTAVRLSPRMSEAHMNLGSLDLQQGRIPEAITAYQLALRLKPGNVVAQTNLGSALFQAGRREEAVAAYEQALRLRPGHLDARLNLGIVLGHLGRYPESIRLFEDVLREYPGHPIARDNLLQLRALRDANAPR